ncbi:MAG: MFS transporter [Pseudomonadales bacterium]|nr:MFS transporter [Pseudomonadales bacterium]
MHTDPRELLNRSPMSPLQIIVVGITIGLNALDGFDVLSISFASPGIAQEWGIDRAALGIVLSMELIGMAMGSLLLGGVADKVGRRPTILGCLMAMALGMFMATTVSSLIELSIWRIVTGLGIGGMLASINAVAAEFSNSKRLPTCIALMSIGYPVGAVLGGMVVAQLLAAPGSDWRSVFYFGTGVTVFCIPLVYFLVPESVHWLSRKQPVGALEKINRSLQRMKHSVVTALPVITAEARKKSSGDIFAPALLAITVILALAYFLHVTTFYFILKWVPKIVTDMGFTPSEAAGVLVWANVGGALGGVVLGLLTIRFEVKRITLLVLFLSAVTVAMFGQTIADLNRIALLVAFAGFFTNAGIVGLYTIMAQAFPTHARAFGTGFAVGFGRGGSVISPIIAGFLFEAGYELPEVAAGMALGSLIAAGVLLFLKLNPDRSGDVPAPVAEEAGQPVPVIPAQAG